MVIDMKRIGKNVIECEKDVAAVSFAAVGGKKEAEGALGAYFDTTFTDSYFGKDSWEKAESLMQSEALNLALTKGNIKDREVDMLFAGDLLNQCISSSFAARSLNTAYLGQYGACTTMAQTIIMAAISVESGAADTAAAVTSSHFCTAERQFRLPLEYGGQRSPSAQWTATASGAVIIKRDKKSPVKIKRMCPGKIIDLGVKDMANMGAAMAPAAAETLTDFFNDTKTSPKDYDRIFTGDLGSIGCSLLYELMAKNNFDLAPYHSDCGVMLYDIKLQDVHAGGSGCGCSASVLCGYILNEMKKGSLKKVLFCATGALMSTVSSQQGESIPGICHLVEFERN